MPSLSLGLSLTSVPMSGGVSLLERVRALFESGAVNGYHLPVLPQYLYEDRSVTPSTPASVDGVVGTRLDISGNNNHAIAPSDAARAILRQSGGLYYLEYDGVDDGYTLQTSLGTSADYLFCVSAQTTDSAYMTDWNESTIGYMNIGQSGLGSDCNPPGVGASADTYVDQVHITQTRNALYTAVNGATPRVITCRPVRLSSANVMKIANYGGGFTFANKEYGKVVIDLATFDADDIDLVERYCAEAAGISL